MDPSRSTKSLYDAVVGRCLHFDIEGWAGTAEGILPSWIVLDDLYGRFKLAILDRHSCRHNAWRSRRRRCGLTSRTATPCHSKQVQIHDTSPSQHQIRQRKAPSILRHDPLTTLPSAEISRSYFPHSKKRQGRRHGPRRRPRGHREWRLPRPSPLAPPAAWFSWVALIDNNAGGHTSRSRNEPSEGTPRIFPASLAGMSNT